MGFDYFFRPAKMWLAFIGLLSTHHYVKYARAVAYAATSDLGRRGRGRSQFPRRSRHRAEVLPCEWRPQGDSNPRYRRDRANLGM
jgi:hypothetical protein